MTSISDTEVVNAPGGLVELGYSQITSPVNITSTNFASPNNVISDISVVCDGSPIVVEVYSPYLQTSPQTQYSIIPILRYDGSLYKLGIFTADANLQAYSMQYMKIRLTPSAGIHTFGVAASTESAQTAQWGAGTGAAGGAHTPSYIRISKIIQASQLLVTQSNAPIVTSLPSGNLVTGQEVDHLQNNVMLRKKWDGSSWITLNAGGSTQPRFAVYNDGGSQINATNKATFNSIAINDGNCWNSNTFTAPVTGKYFFSYSLLSATSTAFYVEFRKNGSTMPTNSFPRGYVAIQYVANTGSGIISLNQNDYIELWVTGGSMHGYHCSFTGYLMG